LIPHDLRARIWPLVATGGSTVFADSAMIFAVSSAQPVSEMLQEDGIGHEVDVIPPGRSDGAEFPASFNNALLRAAIRSNRVTFPSQTVNCRTVPDGDMRWRIVQLYFVCGWPVQRICVRYRVTRQVVHNILTQWRHRAVAAGFVQEVEPGR
jgi:hypothetical protein